MEAIIKIPGKRPEKINIDNSLSDLRRVVGGYLEHYGFGIGIGMLCDEDGRAKGLPLNFIFDGRDFVGPVLFVGEEGGDFVSLTSIQQGVVAYCFDRQILFAEGLVGSGKVTSEKEGGMIESIDVEQMDR